MNILFVEKLIKLIKENPGLEVMCTVNSDIVADEGYAWWLGKVDDKYEPCIDEYATVDDIIVMKSDEDWADWFERLYDVDDFVDVPDDEWCDFCERKLTETLDWKKAIFIFITTPDTVEDDREERYKQVMHSSKL